MQSHATMCRFNKHILRLLHILIIASVLVGSAINSLAQAETIIIPESLPRVDITHGLEFYIDHQNSSIADIRQNQARFTPYSKPTYSEGYRGKGHWLRFTVRSESSKAETLRYLEVNFPFLWHLDLYVFDGPVMIYQSFTGSAFHPDQRPFEHANFVFPIQMPRNHELDFYLHIKNDGPVTVPLTFWEPEAFNSYTGFRQTGFGLYFGIMLAMAMYNFFLFFSIRSPSYFWYTMHVLGIGLINISVSGFGNQYLWRDFPAFGFLSAAFFSYFTNYFALHFTRSFLDTQKILPKLDNTLALLGYAHLAYLSLFFILPKTTSLVVFTAISLVSIILIFTAGLLSYLKGQKTARYFLVAWGIFEITIAIKLMSLGGILPNTNFTYYAVMIGSICEGILLALALADQINEMKEEQNLANQRALKASEESNQVKDQFLATISHELRTPINGIQGSLILLRDQASTEKQSRLLNLARSSTDDLLWMVNTILEFSEIQSGRLHLNNAPFDLAKVLTPLQEEMQRRAFNKGLDFRWKCNIKGDSQLIGDATRILLVAHHLLDNAIKFTQTGYVSFTLTETQGYVQCTIKDTGIGIPDDVQEKIFSSFTQVENGFNRRFGGFGIGLTICQYLLQLMNGKLVMQSKAHEGSEFSFEINLPRTLTKINRSNHTQFQGRALVAEDNPVNMQILCAILQKLGLDTIGATNGEEAIKILSDNVHLADEIDIIFMDCQMPIMDGHEATRRIRDMGNNHLRTVPIIAVTANAMSDDRMKCINSGMSDYVKKPISFNDIINSLDTWLLQNPLSRKTL